jgi:hypothetical protein
MVPAVTDTGCSDTALTEITLCTLPRTSDRDQYSRLAWRLPSRSPISQQRADWKCRTHVKPASYALDVSSFGTEFLVERCWTTLHQMLSSNSEENNFPLILLTVIGANLCARDPLEVKRKGLRGVGGVAYKEAKTVQHCFPAAVLCSFLSHFLCRQCLWFTQYMRFSCTRKLGT